MNDVDYDLCDYMTFSGPYPKKDLHIMRNTNKELPYIKENEMMLRLFHIGPFQIIKLLLEWLH